MVPEMTGSLAGWERIAEEFAFIFCSCDRHGRIHYANDAWRDAVEHEIFPEFLPHCAPNRMAPDAFARSQDRHLLRSYDLVRRGSVSHIEELATSHSANQYRWALLGLQRFGEEVIFSCYFLRYYLEHAPSAPKVRCLIDGKNWLMGWGPDSSAFDAQTTRALCPNCSLLFYSFLRHAG